MSPEQGTGEPPTEPARGPERGTPGTAARTTRADVPGPPAPVAVSGSVDGSGSPDGTRASGPPTPVEASGPTELTDLADALGVLRDTLTSLTLPLDVLDAPQRRQQAARLLAQLDDYLLPRVRSADAPLLVVVGGSTGAGKSTLVNSLLGAEVTTPGVLRPTTRSPVLAHHPLDRDWFITDRILPGFARTPGESGFARTFAGTETAQARAGAGTARGPAGAGATRVPGPTSASPAGTPTLQLVGSWALPRGMALIDAPDVDSVVEQNRDLADQLLAAADLWLFVTTAARYADAVPWELLVRAEQRHTEIALVLSRVDQDAAAVSADLARMLTEHGLGSTPIFAIPERIEDSGMLPESSVGDLARWLTALGTDSVARTRTIEATRDGAVDDVIAQTEQLAHAATSQTLACEVLRSEVEAAYERAQHDVESATSDGTLLRGEVLARWQDFVGTGEFFRALEQRIGRVRDAVTGFFRGRGRAVPATEQAIGHGLEAVILDAAQGAADRAFRAWHADPAGRGLLLGLDLSRASVDLDPRIAEQIRGWQGDVLALVGEQAAGKRGTARALSLGVNGLGVSLMVVVFASTGGITGAELGIAGGTAVLAQRVLEGVFGDEAVRRLTRTAHEQLAARVSSILVGEAARFFRILDSQHVDGRVAQRLARAATTIGLRARAERDARSLRNAAVRTPVGGTARPGSTAPDGSGQGMASHPGPDDGGSLRGLHTPSAEVWGQQETRTDVGADRDEADVRDTTASRGWWKRMFGSRGGGRS